jgi:hypothetical protein
MKVLFTGRGTSGSWQIRGSQLAAALGADAVPNALDVRAYDLAVVVKRAPPDLLQRIRAAGIPLVWDVVDAWPQPEGSTWNRGRCMEWLRAKVAEIRPAGIVAATRAMAADCAEFGLPVLALPHHARPAQERAEHRPALSVVAYEGSERHLGAWRAWFLDECELRKITFAVNPPKLAEADVIVAMREATGYAAMHWKSNVKLANAQAAGLPIICAPEAGYLETASGAECWAVTPREIRGRLDDLQPQALRRDIGARMALAAPTIGHMATLYAEWLRQCRA